MNIIYLRDVLCPNITQIVNIINKCLYACEMATKTASKLEIHIVKRLRALRKERGMSLMKIGEIVGVTQQQASRLERAENQMTASQLYRFARGLDVNVSWFYDGFKEDPTELERLKTVIDKDQANWSSSTTKEIDDALLTAWNALSSESQKERVLAMIEGFAFEV